MTDNTGTPTQPIQAVASAAGLSGGEAVALLRNVRMARATLRALVLAVSAQEDGSVSFDDKAGTERWSPVVSAIACRLRDARDTLTKEITVHTAVDWCTALGLIEALDAALWHGYTLKSGEGLDRFELVDMAHAVVEALDVMLLDCEAAGLSKVAAIH